MVPAGITEGSGLVLLQALMLLYFSSSSSASSVFAVDLRSQDHLALAIVDLVAPDLRATRPNSRSSWLLGERSLPSMRLLRSGKARGQELRHVAGRLFGVAAQEAFRSSRG